MEVKFPGAAEKRGADCDYAKSRGAKALYASCCSAEETIAFYMAMGFRPSAHPIPSCVRDEPFDIQMELPIGLCADGTG